MRNGYPEEPRPGLPESWAEYRRRMSGWAWRRARRAEALAVAAMITGPIQILFSPGRPPYDQEDGPTQDGRRGEA